MTNQNEQEEPEPEIIQTEPNAVEGKALIQGPKKWEKQNSNKARCSAGVTKKDDRWGNNVMISKIEQESNADSFPSVFVIPNPELEPL